MTAQHSTPTEWIADISRIVTASTDRVTGDRSGYPLLVCLLVQRGLKQRGIDSRILYGPAAWIEITTSQQPIWSGCWGEHFSFWVETEFREIVELTAAVSHRRRPHGRPELEALYTPPLLWSVDVPNFFRFEPHGIAELDPKDLQEDRDRNWFLALERELLEKLTQAEGASSRGAPVAEESLNPNRFPNEPILCGRRLLDDSEQRFAHFDRALSVHGIPEYPF